MEYTRYYFWEDAGIYGVRQMGKMDGYNTPEELKEEHILSIAFNRSNGHKCWIAKAEVFEILTTEKEGIV